MDLNTRAYYSMLGKGLIGLLAGIILLIINTSRKIETNNFHKMEEKWVYNGIAKIKKEPYDSLTSLYEISTPRDSILTKQSIEKIKALTSFKYFVKKVACCDFKSNEKSVFCYLLINSNNDTLLLNYSFTQDILLNDTINHEVY